MLKYIGEAIIGKDTRREFIQRAVVWTGQSGCSDGPYRFASPSPSAHADQVDPNDPALTSADVKFASADGAISGY